MKCTADWLEGCEPRRIEKRPKELGDIGEIVTALAAHPQSDLLLLGTSGGKLVVWDPAHQTMVHSLQAHEQDITGILFRPDGQQMFTSSTDGFVHLWDAQLQLVQRLYAECPLYAAALSPNGCDLAAGGQDQRLRIWDSSTGVLLYTLTGQPDVVSACQWLTEKVLITGGEQGSINAWDVPGQRCLRRQQAHQQHVSRLRLGPSGNWYVSASWDGQIKFWNLQHREKFAVPAGADAVTDISVGDDEQLLAAMYWDGSVRLWEIATGRLFDELVACEGSLIAGTILPGAQFLVTSAQSGQLRSWCLADMGNERFINQHSGEIYAVAFSPDNLQVVSTAYDGQLILWDREQRAETDAVESQSGPITACTVTADGSYWITGHHDGEIRLWDTREKVIDTSWGGHDEVVSALTLVPGGRKLISASWDMKIKLWSMSTQQLECVFDGHTKEITDCAVTLDGRKLGTASWDGSARIWDLVECRRGVGRELLVLEGHEERVLCCAFAPDGQSLVTGAADRSLRVWSTEKHTSPRILHGHADAVTVCRFSPDGALLVTADRSGQVMVWDAQQAEPLASLNHKSPILALAIAPDSQEAVIGDESGQIRFFSLSYDPGPVWIPVAAYLKKRSIWTRGMAPKESYQIICHYCGSSQDVRRSDLGSVQRCRNCREQLQLSKRALPALELDS